MAKPQKHYAEISPGISLEGMMLKLKLQYFGHLRQRVDSLEKTLMLEGLGGRRRRGQQRMRWLDGITDSMDMSLSELRRGSSSRGGATLPLHGAAQLPQPVPRVLAVPAAKPGAKPRQHSARAETVLNRDLGHTPR